MHLPPVTSLNRDKRVLLVEDDPDSLALMHRLLARLSIAAVSTTNCAEARRAAADLSRLDLVITDEGLPDGRGSQLATGLAERYGCGIIVVSGSPPSAMLPAGVVQWLTKPLDVTRLREAVAALVA